MDLLASTATGPKVLIVEDDPVSALLVQRMFVSQGIPVHTAVNGNEALELYRRHGYRLVVSDWMMPEMDGVNLCREFRKLNGNYVYFILCSAKGERADRLEAFEAGVDDFLSKPLDREELFSRIKVARRILRNEMELNEQKEQLERNAQLLQDTNESLKVASRRFEELFNGLPVACFTFDEEGLIHEWNNAAHDVFGIDGHEAFQEPIWEVFNANSSTLWDSNRVNQIFEHGYEPNFDWTYDLPDGRRRYLACSVICLKGRNGLAVGAVCANIDVTERKLAEQTVREFAVKLEQQQGVLQEANRKLNHLAVTDGLTGLWNHRRFQEMLEDAMQEAQQRPAPANLFSLILLDIDHFKKFNDEFGHQVGDDVLIKFAATLKETSRSSEFPARYGGEEFAIILEGCNKTQAIHAAERFREAIYGKEWKHRQVSASLGVATWDGVGVTGKELIARADAALYHSKQTGRNRVSHWDEVPDKAAA